MIDKGGEGVPCSFCRPATYDSCWKNVPAKIVWKGSTIQLLFQKELYVDEYRDDPD